LILPLTECKFCNYFRFAGIDSHIICTFGKQPTLRRIREVELKTTMEENQAIKEGLRRKRIERNVQIAIESRNQVMRGSFKTNKKLQRRRFLYTVYRLYRYLDVHPSHIAQLIHSKPSTINRYISNVFVEQCEQNQKCIFKDLYRR